MARKATIIELSEEERKTLSSWVRAGKTEKRYAERALIVLASAEGKSTQGIAKVLNTRTARVSKWRNRFAIDRLKGLIDVPRSELATLHGSWGIGHGL